MPASRQATPAGFVFCLVRDKRGRPVLTSHPLQGVYTNPPPYQKQKVDPERSNRIPPAPDHAISRARLPGGPSLIITQRDQAFLERRYCDFRFFDEQNRRRTTRQRFKTQRTAPSEKIQASRSNHGWREPIEERFPDPLRRWPQPFNISDRQKAAAPFSGYNTQPSGLWFTVFIVFALHTVFGLHPERRSDYSR